MQNEHTAVGLLLLCLCSGTSAIAGEAWIDADPLVAKTLRITASERKRLIRLEKAGILTVRPVALPRGRYMKGKNKTLGWPVEVKAGKTLLCAYHPWLTHRRRAPPGYRDHRALSSSVSKRIPFDVMNWSFALSPLTMHIPMNGWPLNRLAVNHARLRCLNGYLPPHDPETVI